MTRYTQKNRDLTPEYPNWKSRCREVQLVNLVPLVLTKMSNLNAQ